jgi:putative peptidoglycan lipid II flippase
MSRLARSTLIIAVFFGLEKVLGFVRQVAIARTFGLSATLDAYNAANNIPDLLFYLISGGALAIAFIPVLTDYREKRGLPEMWELFSRLANLVFLATTLLSILVALFAGPIVSLQIGVAPGFTAEQRQMVSELMRLNLLATLFLSMGGMVIGGLQANQHFLLPALAPAFYDLGMLFGIFILVPETGLQIGPLSLPAFGMGVRGLVYGAILGSALFLLVQIPGLIYYRFRWKPALSLRHPGVLQALSLLGPRVGTVFFLQFVYVAQDNIASRLAVGTVSAMVYGWLFMQVPETLIGTAIGTALLPTLSEQSSRGDQQAYQDSLNRTLRVLLAITIPAAALLAITLAPVIALLGFDGAGVELVLWTSRAYLLGLIGHSILEVVVRAFYSKQDAITPLVAAFLTVSVFVILAILLGFRLGAPGMALANTLAFSAEALLLLFWLSRRTPGILNVGSSLLRALLAAAAGAGAAFLVMQLPLNPLLAAAAALGVGGIVVLPFIWQELKILIKL